MSNKHPLTMPEGHAQHKIVPLRVASLSEHQDGGPSARKPRALAISIDVDNVPGLRVVFDRQKAGEEFDVIARWGAGITTDDTPVALIDFYLPEFDLRAEIHLEIDLYADSILAGIRSRQALIMDSEILKMLQQKDVASTIRHYQPIALPLPDASPVMGVMQQRFDFPRTMYEPAILQLTPETSDTALQAFIADTKPPKLVAVRLYDNAPPTIILVDPTIENLRQGITDDAVVEGRWGAMYGKESQILRFDAFADKKLLGQWLLIDPPEQLVRVGASGPHTVMLLSKSLNENRDTAAHEWEKGILVHVHHAEALRMLLVP